MSGLDKNRVRNHTVSFRVSPEEHRQLKARIKISGMAKGAYMLQACLHGELSIRVGKYQSDRLGVEIMMLQKQLSKLENTLDYHEIADLLIDCKVLLEQMVALTQNKSKTIHKEKTIENNPNYE